MDPTATSIDPSSSRATTNPSTSSISNGQPSPSALIQSNPNNGSKFPLAPVIGGVVGGVIFIILLVAIIVPCARRRQNRRLRWLTDGDGPPNVLRRDVEASEPLKGSYRDHSRRSSEDKHSLSSSGNHGSTVKSKSSPYVNLNSKSQQSPLAPVMENVTMSSSSHVNTYFPAHGPSLATSTTKLNPSSPVRSPRFPGFDKLWPLTSAFRTSLYSSPSTRTSRTKSSAASSAPSRSRGRNASRRGRKEEPKHLSIDALIGPMSLQQGIGLGRDNDDNMQIKHVRGAMTNDARYETAPMLPAMSAQNNFFHVPPPLSSPTNPVPPGQNGFPGPTIRTQTSTHDPQVSLRRDNSLTTWEPGSTIQPTSNKFYQSQPPLSRESSTRQAQQFPYPEPTRPSPTLRHPERSHHSRSSSDGSKHKHRRERERPTEFVQSSTLLPTTATDLGKPLQNLYHAGNLEGSRHHRRGSASNNLDRQGSHRRTRSRSRSTSRTRSTSNHNTSGGNGHSHSRSLPNSGTTTLARTHSGSRGEHPTGTRNGSGGSRLRRSSERRPPRATRPKIPSYEVNANPPMGYGNGNVHHMSV